MMQGTQQEDGNDIMFVDVSVPAAGRQPVPPSRTIVGMRGRCRLNSWRSADGGRRVFDCSIMRMTQNAIEIAAPVTGTVGEWADVHFDILGRFDGPVIRSGERSFLMRIVLTEENRGKVASRIAWMKDRYAVDVRRHPRFVPFEPQSMLTLADASTRSCEVLDYSACGAALSADVEPEMGQNLKVGKISGRVVRRFAGGFAIEFSTVQSGGSIQGLFMRPIDQDGLGGRSRLRI
jgi:hypothetical protein